MTEDRDDTVRVAPKVPVTRILNDLDDTLIPERLQGVAAPTPPSPFVEPVEPRGIAVAQAYYRFRVGEGAEPITLDVPCYLGRRPSSPRVVAGSPPRLVRVPSPLHEVSATHLEIRQLGASVIVTDLRSTNGSLVMLPGSVPRKLRQGESVVVSPGTLVDIGDDNIIQILPMQRPV